MFETSVFLEPPCIITSAPWGKRPLPAFSPAKREGPALKGIYYPNGRITGGDLATTRYSPPSLSLQSL